MDLRPWLPRITSPALVLGGDEDIMTPWDQGPDGAGQQAIADGIPGAETHVVRGANHSTIFDSTDEHNRVVIDFFTPPLGHGVAAVPSVESYGIEPIPPELRTVGWRDLFAINFTFFLNPVMYVLGALAVLEGGLPLPWAMAAMVLGQALAFAALVVVARPGVDDGPPGPGGDAGHVRPARRPGADVAVPGGRGDVLVRRAGADRSLRHPGDRRGDGRGRAAARADVARGGGRPGRARRARVRRDALAPARRAPALASSPSP